jgi:hypothetical protein
VAANFSPLPPAASEEPVPANGRDFNGPGTAWQILPDDVAVRMTVHECLPQGGRDQSGCEYLVIAAPAGQSAKLQCGSAPLAVLEELEVRIWVKSSRPGVQLAARVVLPRSIDPETGSFASVVIRGEQYTRVGQWQTLVLEDSPKLLANEVRALRTVPNMSIDPRAAYVDAIVLIVPGGPEGTEVYTDDLVVDGVTLNRDPALQPAEFAATAGSTAVATPALGTSPSPTSLVSSIRLQGGILFVEGRPFFPRVVEWQGESLQFLAERGFNTIRLDALPTFRQSADARHHGLWFLCPPPRPELLVAGSLGNGNDRILGWFLEEDAARLNATSLSRWADRVRQLDPVAGRPVVIASEAGWERTSQAADIAVAHHPLANRMSAANFEKWLDSRATTINSGKPVWLSIATQFGETVVQQCELLGERPMYPPSIEDRQLASIVRSAELRGLRGLLFNSNQSLSELDTATQRRGNLLELTNLRLKLIEPWLASGKITARVPSSDRERAATLILVDHARLLVPVSLAAGAAAATPLRGKTFIVPGVPESCQVYYFTSVELRPLSTERVAGGMRINWDGDDDGFVLLTEDARIVTHLRQAIARNAARIVRLERDLGAAQASAIAAAVRSLTPLKVASDAAVAAIASVDSQVRQIDVLLAAGRVQEAHRMAAALRTAMHELAAIQQHSISGRDGIDVLPLAVNGDLIAAHAEFLRRMESLRAGENLLVGGDFEDIVQLTGAGWQHVSHPLPGVRSQVQLSTSDPHHGRHSLELHVGLDGTNTPPSILPSPPVWITTPPIRVGEGQIVEISGWVRVASPITSSVDGLQIVDSLGGPELTFMVGETSGWQAFRIVRGASASTDLRVTFVLTGLGTAHIDGVMVRALQRPVARRLPAVANPSPAPGPVVFDSLRRR